MPARSRGLYSLTAHRGSDTAALRGAGVIDTPAIIRGDIRARRRRPSKLAARAVTKHRSAAAVHGVWAAARERRTVAPRSALPALTLRR